VTAQVSGSAERGRGGMFWAMVPVVLLSLGVGGVVLLGSIASNDPGFALERDYYRRAVQWDRTQAERAENERLGYRVAVETRSAADGGVDVVARVLDAAGAAIRGAEVEVEAFANARAAARLSLRLREAEDGTYRASLGRARPGLWELRFTVVRSSARFTEVVRVDVPRSEP
jgi:hypothetical protein